MVDVHPGVLAASLIAAILTGTIGSHFIFTPEQFAHAYYCSATGKVWILDSINGNTGIYNSTKGTRVTASCKTGWEKLADYCSRTKTDCSLLIKTAGNPDPNPTAYKWTCKNGGCNPQECTIG